MEQGIAFLFSALIANGKSSYSHGLTLSALIANGKSSYSHGLTLSVLIANKPNGEILRPMITDIGKVGRGVMSTNTSKPIPIPTSGQIYPRIINI
jgi:hypothetical protein